MSWAEAVNFASTTPEPAKKPQIVLVLQGGGALGAYQVGAYQALHESGMEPDWIIGTSIGAVNAAIIAGNPPASRMEELRKFWELIEQKDFEAGGLWPWMGTFAGNIDTLLRGIPGLFGPNPAAAWGLHAPVGVERASIYSTDALKSTLTDSVDFEYLTTSPTRLTVGAVRLRSGQMRYFDSRDTVIRLEHILASSALPPAFPAVFVEGEPYWDGGIYSNTPIEAVFDDNPRRDSIVFAVQMWHAGGADPKSIWQVLTRHKDIQYASRAASHIARQSQIHRLRHVVRELVRQLPEKQRDRPEIKELADYGCSTVMHIVELNAPRLDGEDHTRDIDFSTAGIRARWRAGYADAGCALERKPWDIKVDSMTAVAVHQVEAPIPQ